MPESITATVTPYPKLADGVRPSVPSSVLIDGSLAFASRALAVVFDFFDLPAGLPPAALGDTYESSEQPSTTELLQRSSWLPDSSTASPPMLGSSASIV